MKEIEELNCLTLICDIQIHDIMDHNGNLLNSKDICHPHIDLSNIRNFKWIPTMDIKHISAGNTFMSDIFILFGFKWYLWFIPKPHFNSTYFGLYLCLADLPPNISHILVYFKLIITEIGVARSFAIRL